MKLKKMKGFTLLELVIVIAIISILVIIALPRYGNTKQKAEIAAHNANVRAIKNASILYLNDNTDNDIKEIKMADLKNYIEEAEKIKPYKKSGKKEFVILVNNNEINVIPGVLNNKGEAE